jgi:hypothetical protein
MGAPPTVIPGVPNAALLLPVVCVPPIWVPPIEVPLDPPPPGLKPPPKPEELPPPICEPEALPNVELELPLEVEDELLSPVAPPEESEDAYIDPPAGAPPVEGPFEEVGELENIDDPLGELEELLFDPNIEEDDDPNPEEEEDPLPKDEDDDPNPEEEEDPNPEEEDDPNPEEDPIPFELMLLPLLVPVMPAPFCIDWPKNPVA